MSLPPGYKWSVLLFVVLLSFAGLSQASLGDRLPEFRECVQVSDIPSCQLNHLTTPGMHRRELPYRESEAAISSAPLALELSIRVRLHLPACHYRSTRGQRSAND